MRPADRASIDVSEVVEVGEEEVNREGKRRRMERKRMK
jgi:hypothetical protein